MPPPVVRVVLNLCNNAVEAMPDGGTLTIRSYARAGWLCLDIEDTGNGIPAGMNIFYPGISNKSQASGLGLPIVRELVEQQHGTISYTTKPGNGTTFYLKFPVGEPPCIGDTAPPRAATVGAIRMQDTQSENQHRFLDGRCIRFCSPKTDTDIVLLALFIRRSARLNVPRRLPTTAT